MTFTSFKIATLIYSTMLNEVAAMLGNTDLNTTLFTNVNAVQNFSANETEDYVDDDESDELPLAGKVVYGIVIPIMTIVCITGNILTITSYLQDRKLRTVHNTYLISLAVSDLLIGCVSMPFYAVYTLTNNQWPFGAAFCKVFMSIDFLACLESVFVIILVSYDRVMLLSQGAMYSAKQTMKVAKCRIIISWIVAFVVYVPAVIFWDIVRGYSSVEERDCDVEFFNEFGFIIATSVVEFFIPLIIIGSLNIYVYILIMKQSRVAPGQNVASTSKTADSKKATWAKGPEISQQTTASQETKERMKQPVIMKRKRKAARSLAVLVSVFTVCWMPYTVCTVIIAFCEECVHMNLSEAFNWLLWGNSTLNPFLYASTNRQFRLNFIRLLNLQKCCTMKTQIVPSKPQTLRTGTR